jgi:hypothetical protein
MEQPDPTPESGQRSADSDQEFLNADELMADGSEAEEDDEGEGEGEATNMLALNEILPLSQYRLTLSEFDRAPSDRVQFAMDMALIAACERVARILRGDLS